MLARLLPRHNDVDDVDLGDRLADMRLLLLARRVMALGALAVAAAAGLGWIPLAGEMSLVLLVGAILAEAEVAYVARVRTLRAFERGVTVFAIGQIAVVAGILQAGTDVVWIGVLALPLGLAGSGVLLPGRALAVVTAIASIVFTGITLGHELGIVPHSHMVVSSALGHGAAATSNLAVTVFSVLVVSAFVFPAVSFLTFSATQRTNKARREARIATKERRAAIEMASESRDQVELWRAEFENGQTRQNRELEEQNRELATMNAVSLALSGPMDEEGATERAVRLVARLMQVPAVQLYVAPSGATPSHQLLVLAGPVDRISGLDVSRMREAMWQAGPRVIDADEAGDGDEAAGHPFALAPLTAKGRQVGSIAAIGERPGGWDDSSLRLIELIGRELGVALENERLFREAVEAAAVETLLNDISRVAGAGETESAFRQALERVADQIGACVAVAVTAQDGSSEVIARYAVAGSEQLERATDALLPDVVALVAERDGPLLCGEGDEAPLPERLEEAGARAAAVVPLRVLVVGAGLADGEAGEDGTLLNTVQAALLFVAESSDALGRASLSLLARLATILEGRLERDALSRLQERRISELRGLARVAATIQSTIDPERLYAGFARAVFDLVPYEHMYVARLDASGSRLEYVRRFAAEGRSLPDPVLKPGDRSHHWLRGRTVSQWSHDDVLPSFIDGGDVRGLVAPMRPKGQPLGVVVVSIRDASIDGQGALLNQATEHLALALDGASLYRQATERAARLQVFGNLASTVASVVDLRDAFDDFVDEMRWIVPFDSAVMFLVNEGGDELELYAACPPRPVGRRTPQLLDRSPLSLAVERGNAVTFERSDPALKDYDWSALGIDAESVAAVPVVYDGKTQAIFAIVRTEPSDYDVEQLSILEEIAGLLSVSIDRLRLYERAEHNSRHDPLTGLPNQRYLDERLVSLRAGLTEDGESALLMLDVDELKAFNDTLGHEAGDRVLILLAREIRAVCRGEDFVARVGGDEFVIVMEHSGEQAALAVAERLHRTLEDVHTEIPGAPASIRVSIGVALAPTDGRAVADLLRAADAAMYDVKFNDGARTQLAREAKNRASPARRLRRRQNQAGTDALLDAVASGASDAEREALADAERYALATAVRLDFHPDALTSVRLTAAASAAGRYKDRERQRVRDGALAMIDGYNDEWRRIDGRVVEDGEHIARCVTELAWLTAPPPTGDGLGVDDALARLHELYGDVPDALFEALELVARERADRSGERTDDRAA